MLKIRIVLNKRLFPLVFVLGFYMPKTVRERLASNSDFLLPIINSYSYHWKDTFELFSVNTSFKDKIWVYSALSVSRFTSHIIFVISVWERIWKHWCLWFPVTIVTWVMKEYLGLIQDKEKTKREMQFKKYHWCWSAKILILYSTIYQERSEKCGLSWSRLWSSGITP